MILQILARLILSSDKCLDFLLSLKACQLHVVSFPFAERHNFSNYNFEIWFSDQTTLSDVKIGISRF